MNKTIKVELNNFPTIPHGLRSTSSVNNPVDGFNVDLSRLYHHYYTDFWGVLPPDPDHTNFEYLRFLHSSSDFRLLNNRISTSKANKAFVSFRLGQAFCRYFLYEFCGITYFAHMDKVLNKASHPAFEGMKITRTTAGDVPDYLCARSAAKAFIAEAKGRFSSISFSSSDFNDWRNQFTRIRIANRHGINMILKGYIIGTRFTTDINSPSNMAKVFAEDPETIGEQNISDNDFGLARGCLAIHYSRIISKLGFNLIASSLEDGFTVPEEIQYSLPVWKCHYPPLKDVKFVGGFIGDNDTHFGIANRNTIFYYDSLRLNSRQHSFFGLSADTFRTLRRVCLGQWSLLSEIKELQDSEYHPSNLAWLRDGSISGSLDFFEFIGFETF